MPTETPSTTFAMRLKQARVLRGLSLRDLSEKMENALSHVALAKYEQGLNKPSGEILSKICTALEIPPEDLYRPHRVSLNNVSFRKRKSFGEKQTASVLESIRGQLENYLEAEEIVEKSVEFCYEPAVSGKATDIAARSLAKKLRSDWGLDDQPIPSLVDLLEKKGMRIIEVDEPSRHFDGCHIEGIAAIAIGKKIEQPITRKRFTIAHEFGHALLNKWGKDSNLTEKELEKIANAFASEFLVPATALIAFFGDTRTSIGEEELLSAKFKFGMSICAIVYALHELKVIGDNAFKRFQVSKVNSWRKNGIVIEPGDNEVNKLYSEEPQRFQRLVLRGISEGQISLSRGAGLLDAEISDLRSKAVPIVE